MRRFVVMLGAVVAVLLVASPASATYWSGPAAPPAHSCTATQSTLAAHQTAVNTAAAGTIQCLTNGTYSGTLTFNRTAAGVATSASVSGYGAVVTSGLQVNGAGNVTVQGFDFTNATNTANLGDCAWILPGAHDVSLKYSKFHNCYRSGVVHRRPTCTPTPCTPLNGYVYSFALDNSFIQNVGLTDTTGSALIVRTDSLNGPVFSTYTNNELSNGPNDAVLFWGIRNQFVNNRIHDFTSAGSNHSDAFQTWRFATDDGAQGAKANSITMERNRVWAMPGTNSHFLMSEGDAGGTWAIRSNEACGLGGHVIDVGSPATAGQPTLVDINGNTFLGGQSLEYNNASTGILVNNVFRNVTGPYFINGAASVTKDYNLQFGGTSITETHGLNSDPLFVNEVPACGSKDLHLQASSPAVNSGDNGTVLAIQGNDIDAQLRKIGAANDRGSDEQ